MTWPPDPDLVRNAIIGFVIFWTIVNVVAVPVAFLLDRSDPNRDQPPAP